MGQNITARSCTADRGEGKGRGPRTKRLACLLLRFYFLSVVQHEVHELIESLYYRKYVNSPSNTAQTEGENGRKQMPDQVRRQSRRESGRCAGERTIIRPSILVVGRSKSQIKTLDRCRGRRGHAQAKLV